MMSDNSDSENVELEAGLTDDEVRADDRSRPDDAGRLEIIRLMGQLGSGDQILWNERKQPLTVVRRVAADDLRGQCLNFRRYSRQNAARAIQNGVDEEMAKDAVGGLSPTAEFGKEFLLVRGPRGGLYRLTTVYSSNRGRHIPVFQSRTRAKTHASGRFRSSDVWDDAGGTEVLRLARVGHDGDVDPDAIDTDESASYVSIGELSGRPVLKFTGEDEIRTAYEFTDADVSSGVVPSEVTEHVRENMNTREEPDTGVYAARGGVTLDLNVFADTEPDELPSRFTADTFVSITSGDGGGSHISEVPERVHHQNITDDGAHIAEFSDYKKGKTAKVHFGSSYPVFVQKDGKEAIKNAPSASYDGNYQRWVVDAEDILTALESLLDVEGVDTITAPPAVIKYLTE